MFNMVLSRPLNSFHTFAKCELRWKLHNLISGKHFLSSLYQIFTYWGREGKYMQFSKSYCKNKFHAAIATPEKYIYSWRTGHVFQRNQQKHNKIPNFLLSR